MARHPSVPERVCEFLATLKSPPAGIVVAVSGGADSVALLRALSEVIGGRLIVAHFNHGLRGAESDADAEFVAELAENLRLPCRIERRDMRAETHGQNLEAAARAARYSWMAVVAGSEQLHFVATGHNANDQAETVLFRLLRGTGLAGLRGIARQRRLCSEVRLFRPLLGVCRDEIERYLKSIGQPWRQDSSNSDRRFVRNRLRHDLLPLLARDYNPRVSEALGRLGLEAVAWRRAQIRGIARRLRLAELSRAGTTVVLDREMIERLARHTLRALWSAIWQRESWPLQNMAYRDFERIAQWCRSTSRALELPDGIRLARREKTIVAGPTGTCTKE
jgi:tRNA(Ile)-lysidine synthase